LLGSTRREDLCAQAVEVDDCGGEALCSIDRNPWRSLPLGESNTQEDGHVEESWSQLTADQSPLHGLFPSFVTHLGK